MTLITNKRARHDYQIAKTMQAGIVLSGLEVKSLRLKSASLVGSYVKIINKEAFLLNAQINPYKFAVCDDYDPKRSRKLLLTKKQIYQLDQAIQNKNYTLVPLAFELINNKIKLKIGLGRGSKQYEKRAKLKKRDLKKRMAKEFKQAKLKI